MIASRIAAVFAALLRARSVVVVLTDANFDSVVQDGMGKHWFVKFHAPWCGHCKALAPQWAELADKLGTEVGVAKIDVTENLWTQFAWEIQGFPMLKLIADGKAYQYQGHRDVQHLADWARGEYKQAEAEELPAHRSFVYRAFSTFLYFGYKYVYVVLPVMIISMLVWLYQSCCAFSSPQAELREEMQLREAELRKLREKKPTEVEHATVVEPFRSSGKPNHQLREGLKGIVLKYDDDGDALIEFEEIGKAWVMQSSFSKLWIVSRPVANTEAKLEPHGREAAEIAEADAVEFCIAVDSPEDLQEVHGKLAEKMREAGVSKDQLASEPVASYVTKDGRTTNVAGPDDLKNIELPGQMKFTFRMKIERQDSGPKDDSAKKDD